MKETAQRRDISPALMQNIQFLMAHGKPGGSGETSRVASWIFWHWAHTGQRSPVSSHLFLKDTATVTFTGLAFLFHQSSARYQ